MKASLPAKLLLMAILASSLAVFLPLPSDAGIVPCHGSPCTLCHLIVGIKNLVDWGMKILVTATIAGITIAGVMYIVSAGSPGMMNAAKSFITACLTGFALFLGAWLIIQTVMWILSTKPDLGIGKSNWYSFSCNTTSSAPTSLTGSPNGMTDNQAKDACRDYWNKYYASDKTNPDLQTQLSNCDKVTVSDVNDQNKAQALAQAQEECNQYCGSGGDGKTDEATCKTNCMAAKTQQIQNQQQISHGNSDIVSAAQQMKAAGCNYSQPLRNDCKGNPAYTDCGQLACDAAKQTGKDLGNCSSINTGQLYSKAQPVGDQSSLKAGDILVRYNGPGDGHAVICENDGCSTITHAAGKDKGIVTGQKNYMLDSKYNTKVIRT